MKYGLNIRPEGALDLVSLGALVHRLDTGIVPFRKATGCQIHVSGGEFNVAANPWKVHVRSPSFVHMGGVHRMLEGYQLADIVPTFGSVNMIGGECDR